MTDEQLKEIVDSIYKRRAYLYSEIVYPDESDYQLGWQRAIKDEIVFLNNLLEEFELAG